MIVKIAAQRRGTERAQIGRLEQGQCKAGRLDRAGGNHDVSGRYGQARIASNRGDGMHSPAVPFEAYDTGIQPDLQLLRAAEMPPPGRADMPPAEAQPLGISGLESRPVQPGQRLRTHPFELEWAWSHLKPSIERSVVVADVAQPDRP